MTTNTKCPACGETYEIGADPHECKGSSSVQTEPLTPEQADHLAKVQEAFARGSVAAVPESRDDEIEPWQRLALRVTPGHVPPPPPSLEDRVKALELVVDAFEKRFEKLDTAARASALRDIR